MSKVIKLNKGDKVELAGKEYEVTVIGKNQVTLKNVADGKARRVTLTSPAYNKIKVIEASKVTETEEVAKAPKKRVGKKIEVKETVKPISVEEFEQESWEELQKTMDLVEVAPHFEFTGEIKLNAIFYSIQRATKAQRIEYINKKLELEGKDSLFGLFLALYKVRQHYNFDYTTFETRVLQDEVGKGKRLKKIHISKILEAMKPAMHKSQAKIDMEVYDDVIHTIPDDGVNGKQSWIFNALTELWSEIGSLKLSEQDLANITIPMA